MADGAELIYITSHPHSGSTLLDVVLGGHPEIVGTGEIHRLSLDPTGRLCTCRDVVSECEFWTEVATSVAGRTPDNLEHFWTDFSVTVDNPKKTVRYLPDPLELALIFQSRVAVDLLSKLGASAREHLEMASNSWRLYEAVAQVSGARYVVDSTKNLLRLKLLHHLRPDRLKVLHLSRRPEAIAASAKRREDRPVADTLRSWVHWEQKTSLALSRVDDSVIFNVGYEAFCQHPEETLRGICDFLGVSYVPEMVDLNEGRQHQVPGNPMLFQDDNNTIKYDQSWDRELSEEEIRRARQPYTWSDRLIQSGIFLFQKMAGR